VVKCPAAYMPSSAIACSGRTNVFRRIRTPFLLIAIVLAYHISSDEARSFAANKPRYFLQAGEERRLQAAFSAGFREVLTAGVDNRCKSLFSLTPRRSYCSFI